MVNDLKNLSKMYLDSIVNEYNSQESKKNSIELRAGTIIGFYSAFLAMSIKDVHFSSNIYYCCTCYSSLKILLVLFYYILVFLSFYNSYQVLSTKKYYTVELKKIDKLETIDSECINKLVQSYFQVLEERININNTKSKYFKKLLLVICFSILSYALYSNLFI